METLKTLLEHKTIRKYKDKPIEEEKLTNIFKAASRASTTGGMQVYSIIKTEDEKMKDKLHEIHFGMPMLKEAPVTLTFVADFNRFNKWCEARNAKPVYDNFMSFMTAAIDAVIAAQNACVAAEDQGLGICYIGTVTYQAKKLIDLFELPKGVVPVACITIGYPNEDYPQVDRLPLDAVVHNEKYHDYSEEDIDKVYEYKESLDSSKQFIEENNKETLPQVFTEVRYPKKMNVDFSNTLLEVLEEQGFMNNSMDE
ncbi:MAG: NADPH-dependent oxidoreductase [Bacteroidales bacterium]|nr:NADPH-dependent oxidoreductase [Bacteroidales bacterium]MCF8327862.1 NADPH-dependent oxidoreductase [Bacteroidales bacterium]